LDVANSQVLVERLGIHIVVSFEGLQRLVVICTASDCFLENRRVGRHPHETIMLDETLELARGDQTALNVVIPYALSILLNIEQWIGHASTLPTRAFASATICSTVNLNSFSKSLRGAEAPKSARAMIRLSRPT